MVKITDSYTKKNLDIQAEKIACPLFTAVFMQRYHGNEYSDEELATTFEECMEVGYKVLNGIDRLREKE